MQISKHAEERLRKRVGIKKKSIPDFVEKVLKKGTKPNNTHGNLKAFLHSKYASNKGYATKVLIYGDFIYLFDRYYLITVLSVPPSLRKLSQQVAKERDKHWL